MKRVMILTAAAIFVFITGVPALAAGEPDRSTINWTYYEDFSGYSDVNDVFASSSPLVQQNASAGGHIYELADEAITVSNETQVGINHVCLQHLVGINVGDDAAKLHYTFTISAEDKNILKYAGIRYYLYDSAGARLNIIEDAMIRFTTQGYITSSVSSGDLMEYETGEPYLVDYVVDLYTGYRRLYINNEFICEGVLNSILFSESVKRVEISSIRLQYMAKKNPAGDYNSTRFTVYDIGYKVYDVCTGFSDEFPYIKENHFAVGGALFYDDGEEETNDTENVPYNTARVVLPLTEGKLTGTSVTPDTVRLSTGERTIEADVGYEEERIIITLNEALASNTEYNITLMPGITLLNGNEYGKTKEFLFKTGFRPFDVETGGFVVNGGPAGAGQPLGENDNVAFEAVIKNTTGAPKEAVAILLLYDEEGRLVNLTARTVLITEPTQTIATNALEVHEQNMRAEAFVINGWSTRNSVNDVVYR